MGFENSPGWIRRVVLASLGVAAVGAGLLREAGAGQGVTRPERELTARRLHVLREALAGREFWPAMHAAEGLTLAGRADEVREALAQRLPTETDDQHRCGLARELVRAGDRTGIGRLLEILVKPGSNGHTHAAESLYKIAEVGDGQALRSALTKSENPGHQLMVAAALARCGSPTALAVIRDARDRGDQEQKKIAAWILGLLGGPEDVEPLRRNAAAEKDPLARAYAIHALALLGDAEGRKGLGRNLRSGSAAIRTYAAEFAGYAGVREERARLIRLLDDSNVDVRVRAAQALGMLDQPPTKRDEVVVQDVFPPSPRQPRYSEGSLLALTDGTLLYATTEFLGGGEDHATAHIVARRSADGGRTWGPPTELQANTGRQNVMSVTLRRLLPGRADGPIGMVYLVKNGPNDLHAFLRISQDEARRWGPAIRITGEAGYHVVNNDRLTVLQSGRLLCPVAASPDFQQLNHFVSYCYLSDDRGQTWRRGKGSVDQPRRGAMEPEVVELTGGRLLMICRTQLGIVAASYSQDGGDTWGTPFSLTVRAPESPQTIRRIPATGDLLLVWNNSFQGSADHGGQRTPLTVAVSSDEGRSWRRVRDLEVSQEHGYAYTSVTFVQDRVLFTYYVHDVGTGRIGSRFRSVPVGWLYQ